MIKICREEGSNGCGNGDGRDEGAASQQCKSAVLARIQQTWQHEAAEYDQWRWVKWMWRFWIDVIAWPIVLDGKEWRYEKNSEGVRYRLRFPVISSFGYVDFPPKNVNFPLRRNFHLLISLSRLKKKVHAVSIFRSFPNERYRLNAFCDCRDGLVHGRLDPSQIGQWRSRWNRPHPQTATDHQWTEG